MLIPTAIGLPFLMAYGWWKFTLKQARGKPPRIPDQEVSIRLSDSDLVIGYPQAVSRYGWDDIVSLLYSERFIAFQPFHGLIHVVANKAFGGADGAIDFLKQADRLRKGKSTDASNACGAPVETGNPYQSPPLSY
jgi:hypothetical protein